MPLPTKTDKAHPAVFQITKIEEDSYILIGDFTRQQLEALVQGLQPGGAQPPAAWSAQFQALAVALAAAYDRIKGE